MRINKFLAENTKLSRRSADKAILEGRVLINGRSPKLGDEIKSSDKVSLDGKPIKIDHKKITIAFNKPVGYVCSRSGQGSKTIYDLLPSDLHHLNPVGRLDKDSSGLLLLTNDGELAFKLTHPKFQKKKVYQIILDKELSAFDQKTISKGVKLEDGLSRLQLKKLGTRKYEIIMHEGRNRQIRRIFSKLNYKVVTLNRIAFGNYHLSDLPRGSYKKATF